MRLSHKNRKQRLDYLQNETLDLLIIGGGITGAGLALQGGAQNLKTGLIEMQDFAAGTSSRSTKLVHGGLRYLKQFEVELVADITKERAVISKNAPHIVKPEWMLLPVYDEPDASFTPFSAAVALDLYDRLAEVEPQWHHYFISKEEVLANFPGLNPTNLVKGGLYLDYKNDDARLTLEILKKAVDLGAVLANYVKMTGFLKDEKGQIIGVEAYDVLTDAFFEINAKVVVNATGHWSDAIRKLESDVKSERMYPTKGVHFVVDAKKLPVARTVYVDTGYGDNRMIFIIPRGEKTYFGTTDTPYTGDLVEPGITIEDVKYMLGAVNLRFPKAHLTIHDIETGWSGLRPLLLEEGATDPSSISRTHEVMRADSGLVTIAGGKLTDYRLMAQDTFDVILAELSVKNDVDIEKVATDDISLSGGELPAGQTFEEYVESVIPIGLSIGLSKDEARYFAEWYGTNVETIFALADEIEQIDLPLHIALSLVYAIKYEGIISPVDFFLRRTEILLFATPFVEEWKNAVVTYMAKEFSWSNAEQVHWLDELNDMISLIQLETLRVD